MVVKNNIDVAEQKKLFSKYVRVVYLETSSYCNRKCLYCPVAVDDYRKKQLQINDLVFEKIINELEEINYSKTITFHLFNEPMADQKLFYKIDIVRKKLANAFLMLNTNGDYLTKAKLNELSGLKINYLIVTLHPSSKNRYDISEREIALKKIIKKLGIENAVIEKPYQDSLNIDVEWNGMALKIRSIDWSSYGSSRAGAVDFLTPETDRISPCVRPLSQFVISHNGDVFPCCTFYPETSQSYVVGNVGNQSIFEIYSSKTLAMWRKHLFTFGKKNSPCDKCNDEDFANLSSVELRKKILTKSNV